MLLDVNMKEIITTFISAIDIVNPILKHHHRRTAIIAYHLGRGLELDPQKLANLVVAATLHDVGALTVKDAEALVVLDVEDPEPHSILGAGMLSSYKAFHQISNIIKHHHISYEENLVNPKEGVLEESFLLHLADRIEILLDREELALNQKDEILNQILKQKGKLFKPEMVEVFSKIASREYFWFDIDDLTILDLIKKVDLDSISNLLDLCSLEELIYTLSRIIDYKCKFTASHSVGVAYISYELARYAGLSEERARAIKIAGYLHDIGKIAVPSEIISKPGKLTPKEFNVIKSHPYYTYQILKNIKGMEEMAKWAGSHHEKKDHTGYPRKPEKDQISIEIEIIAYADVFTALCENRPYRKALDVNQAMAIIKEEWIDKMGNRIYDVLAQHAETLFKELRQIQSKSESEYHEILWGKASTSKPCESV